MSEPLDLEPIKARLADGVSTQEDGRDVWRHDINCFLDREALIAEVERLRRCPNCGNLPEEGPRGPCAGHGTRWATYD